MGSFWAGPHAVSPVSYYELLIWQTSHSGGFEAWVIDCCLLLVWTKDVCCWFWLMGAGSLGSGIVHAQLPRCQDGHQSPGIKMQILTEQVQAGAQGVWISNLLPGGRSRTSLWVKEIRNQTDRVKAWLCLLSCVTWMLFFLPPPPLYDGDRDIEWDDLCKTHR